MSPAVCPHGALPLSTSPCSRDAMDFHLFMYCTVGRRHELEAGMAGQRPELYQRMLDEIADYVRFADEAGSAGWRRRTTP
jgi:hypothetical protein